MAVVISGTNNSDKITATDGLIDLLSSVNFASEVTVPSFKVGSDIQIGNAGIITATTLVGNVTGNINHTSNLLLQISGSEKFRVGTSGQLGIGGANYGTSGQVLTSGGSSSAATWSTISGTTINNNADNRVITGSGSANTLEGESGLTYSSNTLDVTNAVKLPDDGTVHYGVSDTAYVRGKDSTDGYLKLGTAGLERFRIGSSGQFGIGGATYGTSGQVLASQGSSSAPQWATPGLIYEGSATSFPTNTGVVDADVILDACRRIEIYYLGVSINSNSGEIIIQLRTGSGTITSGYKGSGHYLSNTSYATSSQNTSSFQSQGLGDASASYSGHVVLKNYNAHYWYCNADFWNDNAATGYWISGHVNAGAALAGVRLSNAAGSYDSGEYKIMQYNTP